MKNLQQQKLYQAFSQVKAADAERENLQQQKLYQAFSPDTLCVHSPAVSTIVEIISGFQPKSQIQQNSYNLQQQKLYQAFSQRNIERDKFLIYNSRNYIRLLASFSITIHLINLQQQKLYQAFSLDDEESAQGGYLQQQKLYQAFSPGPHYPHPLSIYNSRNYIRLLANHILCNSAKTSTIVEIISGFQPLRQVREYASLSTIVEIISGFQPLNNNQI